MHLKKLFSTALFLFALLGFPLLSNDSDMVWMKWLGTSSIRFTPDDSRVVAFSNPVLFYETETGKQLGTIPWVRCGEYTPEGKLLIINGLYQAELWDTDTYEKIRDYPPIYKGIKTLSLSKNNFAVSLTTDEVEIYGVKTFVVWDFNTGVVIDSISYGYLDETKNTFETVKSVKITPDGKYIITSIFRSEFDIKHHAYIKRTYNQIFSREEMKVVREIENANTDVFISSTSKYFARKIYTPLISQDDSCAKVYDLETGEEVLMIPGYPTNIDIDFSSDDKYMAVAFGIGKDIIEIWDINNKQIIYTYSPKTTFEACKFSSNGKYLTASTGTRLRLFRTPWYSSMPPEKQFKAFVSFPNPTKNVVNVEFDLLKANLTKIDILDLKGKDVKKIFNNFLSEGKQRFTFDLSDLSNGSYFLNIQSGNSTYSEKIIINK